MHASKYIRSAFCIITLALLLTGCIRVKRENSEWLSDWNPKLYTKQELIDLFDINQDDFEEISELLLNNELIKERMAEKRMGHFRIDHISQNEFFKDSDWRKIEKFYYDYGLNYIELDTSYSGDVVSFQFGRKSIKRFSNEDDVKDMQKFITTIEKLTDNWWVRVNYY